MEEFFIWSNITGFEWIIFEIILAASLTWLNVLLLKFEYSWLLIQQNLTKHIYCCVLLSIIIVSLLWKRLIKPVKRCTVEINVTDENKRELKNLFCEILFTSGPKFDQWPVGYFLQSGKKERLWLKSHIHRFAWFTKNKVIPIIEYNYNFLALITSSSIQSALNLPSCVIFSRFLSSFTTIAATLNIYTAFAQPIKLS